MAGKQGRRAKRRKPKQSYASLQESISKRETAKDFVENFAQDLYDELEADFNLLIKTTVADLTSDAQKGGYSPVLTGFFASNWKAGPAPIVKDQTPKDTKWERIKTTTIYVKPIAQKCHGAPRSAFERHWGSKSRPKCVRTRPLHSLGRLKQPRIDFL